TGARDALWRVHGRARDAVWAAGENALLRFDGAAWRAMDLDAALGPNAWPTLVDVHAAADEVIAVGTQIEGPCLLRVDRGGALRRLSRGPRRGASALGFEGGRLVIGLAGQLWDVALPAAAPAAGA